MRQTSPPKVLLAFPESHYNSRGGRTLVTEVSSREQRLCLPGVDPAGLLLSGQFPIVTPPVPFDTDGTITYLLQGGVNKTVLRTVLPPINFLVGFRYYATSKKTEGCKEL